MSVNKARLGLQNKIIGSLKQHSRDIRALKTPQQIGADILQVQTIPPGGTYTLFGPFGVYPPQTGVAIGIQATPVLESTLTLYNFAATLFIDDSLDAEGHISPGCNFPTGIQLPADIVNVIQFSSWYDLATSDNATNSPTFIMQAFNNETPESFTSHTFYFGVAFYIPNANITIGTVTEVEGVTGAE